MKQLKKFAVAVCAASAVVMSLPAPAFADIHQVSCGNRTDFLKIRLPDRDVCFASKGTMLFLELRNPYLISAGNNNVLIGYDAGPGDRRSLTLKKGDVKGRYDGTLPHMDKITGVAIL